MEKWMAYLLIINFLGCFVMWQDKSRARHHAWRIPERVLFGIAVLGGSIGSLAGMYLFRHKTKHASFVLGMPAILILQIFAILFFRPSLFFL